MKNLVPSLLLLFCFLISALGCKPKNKKLTEQIISVNPTYFITESLVEDITKEKHLLSDGTKADCYKIVTKSVPHEHTMGPWCPRHVKDSKENGGIWFENGKVYDVDGHFISNIGTFYKDEKWKL